MREGTQVFCFECKGYHYLSKCSKEIEPNPLRHLIESTFYYCPKFGKNSPALLVEPRGA